ncbi:phage portal protein [Microbacterium candidum]|uniref:Phage portal protein n=1 Tax=Microbacterium candidum TaxID=3041922 RepID=A0ABT7MWL7_9MICO|nr:phage portal protein [Microbacterium sp. ASV49]MDL9978844.1 phage portal protein [Microbacterium sp. ASV49]
MTWISRLLFGPPASAATVLGVAARGGSPLMPWTAPSEFTAFVWSDIYSGAAGDAVTRDTAMRVAPIKRGRALIVSLCSDLPLVQGSSLDGAGELVPDATQPAWLTTGAGAQTAWHRMALTLDDLIFGGWSLWVVVREPGTVQPDGTTVPGSIIEAGRLHPSRWAFDQSSPTGVAIDNRPVIDPASVILIAGPDEGLLSVAADAIRGWRHMEEAWVGRVRNPIPAMVLHEKAENGVSQTEAEAYVAAWAKNRLSPNGAVGFLPASLDLEVHGESSADLFTEGRNAARIDIANHLNLPVSMLDGSPATASLTYATQEGTHAQIVDDLEYWLAPIEARLSQPDVCPTGRRVRFSRENLTAASGQPYGATAAPQPKEVAA